MLSTEPFRITPYEIIVDKFEYIWEWGFFFHGRYAWKNVCHFISINSFVFKCLLYRLLSYVSPESLIFKIVQLCWSTNTIPNIQVYSKHLLCNDNDNDKTMVAHVRMMREYYHHDTDELINITEVFTKSHKYSNQGYMTTRSWQMAFQFAPHFD